MIWEGNLGVWRLDQEQIRTPFLPLKEGSWVGEEREERRTGRGGGERGRIVEARATVG